MARFKCPICYAFVRKDIKELGAHINRKHLQLTKTNGLVDGFHYARWILTGKKYGACTVCGEATEYNPKTTKFSRLCDNPKCRESVAKTCAERIKRVHGVTHLLNKPSHMMKVMAGHKNSGVYAFSDGTIHPHHSTEELEFLRYMDKIHHWPGDDLITSGSQLPLFVYVSPVDKAKHIYYPDCYIRSLNLIVEIKNTSDTNTGYRLIKNISGIESAKEAAVLAEKFNYVFVENMVYDKLDSVLFKLRKK